ncbi:MAG: hypothetical protein ACI4XQ_01925 [Eubacteriales bacterium]
MYKISVPMVRYFERHEDNIRQARRLGAERVFLCPGRGLGGAEENDRELSRLRENIRIYEDAGFEVGVWISTLGHGGELVGVGTSGKRRFTNIVGLRGKAMSDSFCPLDEEFVNAECRWVRGIAKAGAKLIMLDDDFRLSNRGDCGCTCEAHMAKYRRRIGENISREELLKKAFTGGANHYRKAWYDLMGDTLRGFAAKLRAAADEADPSVRMGACACMSVWDADGADSIEIARILAGKNKPFMRFIGAPYWAKLWGEPVRFLPYVAELERMQRHWCENAGIEIFGEGDVYPRPRNFVPAAYLEAFDMILRADGGFDGILKYGIDYTSSPVYETGYADRAERNASLSREIEARFGGKKSVGVGVVCEMKKILERSVESPAELGDDYDNGFFQPEQSVLVRNSVPVTYEPGAEVLTAFGENGKYCPADGRAFLLDAKSAEFLEKRGVDTGLSQCEKLRGVSSEFFFEKNESVYLSGEGELLKLCPKDGAEVLSEFRGAEGSFPSAIRYENAAGQRFLVLGFNAEKSKSNIRFFWNYCRQSQLIDSLRWLGKKPLAASCPKNPGLYIMCKRGEGSMAVGLWNMFEDAVLSPEIELDREYSRAEFIGCGGVLKKNRVCLSGDIVPFSFAGFEVFD